MRRSLPPRADGEPAHVAIFLAGRIAALIVYAAAGTTISQTVSANVTLMAAGVVPVGFGAAYGGGCTSEHGVCGLSRRLPSSGIVLARALCTPRFASARRRARMHKIIDKAQRSAERAGYRCATRLEEI